MDIDRQRMAIEPGWINAAGTLGLAPPASWPLPQPPSAFVTNPISYRPRRSAQERCIQTMPGGFLLHTGWPSPGFREVLRQYRARWARSQVPIWVHLLGDEPTHVEKMTRQLEETEGVEAIEISYAHEVMPDEILDLVRSAIGELPLVLSIPLDRIGEAWLRPALELGVSAISLSPPRGAALRKSGQVIHGRLYGPAILPLAMTALERMVQTGIPVIAGGGVMRQSEIDGLIRAGAATVQLDFVLWRGWQADKID